MSASRTLLFSLLFATALPAAAAGNPAALLRTFLDAHGNQSGLPTGDKVAAIRPFLSEALDAAMARARKEQEDFIARHPEQKPPWIEGPLFHSSGAEPFTAYAIVLPAGGCPDTRCVVRVDMVDTVASPDVLWYDEFVVVQEDGGWRLDDVNYRAGFDFGNHGTLRTNLEADPAE